MGMRVMMATELAQWADRAVLNANWEVMRDYVMQVYGDNARTFTVETDMSYDTDEYFPCVFFVSDAAGRAAVNFDFSLPFWQELFVPAMHTDVADDCTVFDDVAAFDAALLEGNNEDIIDLANEWLIETENDNNHTSYIYYNDLPRAGNSDLIDGGSSDYVFSMDDPPHLIPRMFIEDGAQGGGDMASNGSSRTGARSIFGT